MTKTATTRRREPGAPQMLTRRASLRATSFNAASGTFTAIAATSHPVRRRGFDGDVLEVLSITPATVRLDRLRSGHAPLLDSHRAGSISDQIGVITAARIEDGNLIVDAQLSARNDDRLKQIHADLAGGIIRNVSIGYVVHASREGKPENGVPTIIRTDWEPAELSLVAIPGDPKAFIRNAEGTTMENDQTELDRAPIAEQDENREGADAPATRMMSDRDVRESLAFAARHQLGADFAQQHIDAGSTLKDFRKAVLNHLADKATPISSRISGLDTLDNPDFLGRSIEGALYARMTGQKPEDASADLMGRSLLDMGAMLLQARGERVSWANRERLASQMLSRDLGGLHSTSDFPSLLTGAGNRVLQDAYKAAECPLKVLARRRDATDFRAISLLKLSEAPRLSEVGEGGEVTHGSRSETKEGFKVKTYAKIFGLTRQAIINDDLGAFSDSNMAWGRAAAETEAELLVGLFTANAGDGANLDDGSALYTTARENKAMAGGAIAIATLGSARQAMRETKGPDGMTPIGVTPKHLVVGPAKETEAEQVLAAIAAAQVSNANPFSGKLTLHVEPRFAGNAWRLFADPTEIATIVIAYLNGQAGPILESRQGWNTLGAEFRAVLDFGCGLAEWRGTYLNPGN